MSRQKTLNELFCTTSRGSQNSVVSEGASKGGSSSGTSGGGSENPPCFSHNSVRNDGSVSVNLMEVAESEQPHSFEPDTSSQSLSEAVLLNYHQLDQVRDMPSLTATTSSPSSSSIASPCECQCCTNFNIPYHPSAVDSSKRQQLYSIKEHGKQKSHSRTIQSSWYEAHPWMSVLQKLMEWHQRWTILILLLV